MTSRDPKNRPTIEEVLSQDWFQTNSNGLNTEQKLKEATNRIEELMLENQILREKLSKYENQV